MVLLEHDAHHRRNINKARRMITLGHVENFHFHFVFKIENKLNLF